MSRRGALLLVVLTVTALGGCAEEKPRIPLGQAQPAKPITLAAKPDRSGLLPFSKWPAACDLLPEAAVREVLPAATTVGMKRSTPSFNSGNIVEKDLVFPGDAECEVRVDFAEARELQAGRRGGWIYLTVRAAGTPELARKNYDENVATTLRDERDECPAGFAAAAGLDDCTHEYDKWTFLKKGIAGELRGIAPYLNEDVYFDGQKENSYPTEIWQDVVEPEMVRAVAARLP